MACESEGELAANHLAAARKFHADGDLAAAAVELKVALQNAPDLADARLLLGEVALRLGDAAGAEKELERAKKLGLDGRELGAQLTEALIAQRKFTEALLEMRRLDITADDTDWTERLGSAHLGLGKLDEAGKVYARALELDPESTVGLHGLIRVSILSGDSAAADRHIEQAVAAHPEHATTWVLKGENDFEAGRLEAANEAYARAHEIEPDDLAPRIGLVRTALERGESISQAELDWLDSRHGQDARVAFLLGKWAYVSGEADVARRRLLEVVAAFPRYDEALKLLGNLHVDDEAHGQAEEYLRRYVALVPGDVAARKQLAKTQLALGTPERAVATLLPALAGELVESDLLALLSVAYAGTGDIEKAQLIRAAASSATGQVPTAALSIEDAGEVPPALSPSQTEPVVRLIGQRRFKQAVVAATEVAEQFPYVPDAHNLLGGALESAGRLDEARAAYERAQELEPRAAGAALNLARVAILQGNPAEARGHYERVLASLPFNSDALLGLASIALDAGRSDEAVELLEAARGYDSSLVEPRLTLGKYYLQTREMGKAVAVAEEAMQIAPERADVRILVGQARAVAGNPDGAVRVLSMLTEDEPTDANAWFYLGLAHFAAGDRESAHSALSTALGLDAANELAATNLVNMELAAGRGEQALEIARGLVAAAPETATALALEGRVLLAIGRADDALGSYSRAFDLERRQDVLFGLVDAHLATGKQDEGLKLLEDWLGAHPTDATALLLQGNALYVAGRLDEAAVSFERLVELQPEASGALNNLATIYHELGNDKALAIAERAHRQAPDDPGVLDTYGWLLLERSEQTALAVELLTRARQGLPRNASVRYHFAAALAKSGDVEGAKAELEFLLSQPTPFPERPQAQALKQTLDLM